MELIKIYIPLLLSLIAVVISIFALLRDKSRLTIGWDICCNTDHSENWVEITITNCGRRPALIQSIGYYSNLFGMDVSSDNKNPNVVIQPSTSKSFREDFERNRMWVVGGIFVIDESGKRWSNSKNSKRIFTSMATSTPRQTKHLALSKKYPTYLFRKHRKFLATVAKSPDIKQIEKELSDFRETFGNK